MTCKTSLKNVKDPILVNAPPTVKEHVWTCHQIAQRESPGDDGDMWFISCLLTSLAWAAVPSKNDKALYPPQRISGRGIERIEIIGVRGKLHLTGTQARGFRLKVGHTKSRRSDDWNLLVERREHTLFLEVASSAYGSEWRKLMRQQQYPEFDIELEGPSLPTVVSWREGSLSYTSWKAPLETSFTSGDVHINGGSGHHVLKTGKSRVLVRHFKGELELRGERGQVDLLDLEGRLRLNWLSGPLTLTDVRSQTQIESSEALVRIHGGRGEWALRTEGGRVSLNEFGGHFKGQGRTTHWNVRGRLKSDIELINASGPVQVDWGSTARVFLTSASGAIFSPYDIQDRDGRRVAEGRKGTKPLGQVFVRTETGDITFKY